jgi:hypothetical protein
MWVSANHLQDGRNKTGLMPAGKTLLSGLIAHHPLAQWSSSRSYSSRRSVLLPCKSTNLDTAIPSLAGGAASCSESLARFPSRDGDIKRPAMCPLIAQRAPAHSPWGMLEMTGTPVLASRGAMISSVRNPPQDISNESASGADQRTLSLNLTRSSCITLSTSVMASIPSPVITSGARPCSRRNARRREFTSSLYAVPRRPDARPLL